MRTATLVLALTLGSVLATARPAAACDCGVAPTDSSLLAKSANIFVGRVVSTLPKGAGVRVQVLATWRGVTAGATLTVSTSSSDCGFHLNDGSTWLFFTSSKHKANQCRDDEDVRAPTAAALAFLGPPKAEISDAELAKCVCTATSPTVAKRTPTGTELRVAGNPVSDGRYLRSYPLAAKGSKDPVNLITPAGGCAFKPPRTAFWIGYVPGTVNVNACTAELVFVK